MPANVLNSDEVQALVFEQSRLSVLPAVVSGFCGRRPAADRTTMHAAALRALWRAAATVDLDRTSGEARSWLITAMRRAMLDESAGERAGIAAYRRLADAMARVEAANGGPATDAQIAAELSLDLPGLAKLRERASRRFVFERGAEEGGDTAAVADDSPGQNPADSLMHCEQASLVRAAVARLPIKMRHVVEASYFGGKRLADTSRELGVSRARVSILHKQALARLAKDRSIHAALD